ncbi:hypothetical protein CPB86DRAFT_698305 [Serendipita vermifera]|nr:hypothetical protein CPB86DRAFT_698305 [Serendipita vermifera]
MSGAQKRKIVITRNIGQKALSLLDELNRDEWEITLWEEDRAAPRPWLEENVAGAEGLLVLLTDKVDEELLKIAGPSLHVLSTMSVGYDHLDIQALESRRIKVGFTPDVLTSAVADLTVLLCLMATRNGGQAVSVVNSGKWPGLGFGPFVLCGPQIGSGADGTKPYTVGFVGFGRIAKATLHRLSPYGISRCLYANTASSHLSAPLEPSKEDVALAQEMRVGTIYAAPLSYVAEESDLVIVLAPGGKETYHIIDEAFLKKMKKTAVLVNTSRGTLVDTDALVKALREEWIWAAGLDVVEGEPNILGEHPLVQQPRAVIFPHIGSATIDTREAMAQLSVVNLVNGLLGRELEKELKLY